MNTWGHTEMTKSFNIDTLPNHKLASFCTSVLNHINKTILPEKALLFDDFSTRLSNFRDTLASGDETVDETIIAADKKVNARPHRPQAAPGNSACIVFSQISCGNDRPLFCKHLENIILFLIQNRSYCAPNLKNAQRSFLMPAKPIKGLKIDSRPTQKPWRF